MLAAGIWHRIDSHDRDLFRRSMLRGESPAFARWGWIAITHVGGAVVTIASVALPLLFAPWSRGITVPVAGGLVLSHLAVQAMKRFVGRERPEARALIRCPDCWSFPSGHATAALSVALGYGLAVPALAPALVAIALVVGWSRVVLGVHYPGDVLVGQLIATGTVLLVTGIA